MGSEDAAAPKRLDRAMVARGLAATRARAQDLIRRGLVKVGGSVEDKPGRMVSAQQTIEVAATHAGRAPVSRGSEKLAAALSYFSFPVAGRRVLDVGASTGGFTQALLEAGAAHVWAVDVGHGQLHPTLAADPRVTRLEGVDARELDRALIPQPIEAIVADVSFISLTKVLPAPLALAAGDAWLIALIKPQFEAGRAAVGKGGIVRDEAARARAVEEVRAWVAHQPGWRVVDVIVSPIKGGSGNVEFLLGAVKTEV